MLAVSSSDFLKEFTLLADRATDEKETFVIQRASGKNAVFMSLDRFNELQKELFVAKRNASAKDSI